MFKFNLGHFPLSNHCGSNALRSASASAFSSARSSASSSASDAIIAHICNHFKNKKLKKIVNVFQMMYINEKAQGFGDFFRGSIYLTHLCKLLNVTFDINLSNHPVSTHFINQGNQDATINYNNIYAYIDKTNRRDDFVIDFIDKLNTCDAEIAYIYCNYDPRFDIENPKHCIIHCARNIVIPKIEPKEYVLNLMDKKLAEFNIKRNQYDVIHIRCGDHFMIAKDAIDPAAKKLKKIAAKHANYIINDIGKNYNKNAKYILIGDSRSMKNIVSKEFNNIFIFNSEIIHLGENCNFNEKSLIETLIDFSIVRYSNHAISYSAYRHGSGFSKQCAHIYGIPFKQILLNPPI